MSCRHGGCSPSSPCRRPVPSRLRSRCAVARFDREPRSREPPFRSPAASPPRLRARGSTSRQLRLGTGVEVDLHEAVAFAHELLASSARAEDIVLDGPELSGELLPDWYDDWVLIERERSTICASTRSSHCVFGCPTPGNSPGRRRRSGRGRGEPLGATAALDCEAAVTTAATTMQSHSRKLALIRPQPAHPRRAGRALVSDSSPASGPPVVCGPPRPRPLGPSSMSRAHRSLKPARNAMAA